MRKTTLLLVALAVGVSSCVPFSREVLRDFSDNPVPVVGEQAFFGEIVEIDGFDPDEWMSDGSSTTGGPESGFLSGSARFVLYDGTELDVRDGTPAGNRCLPLNPYEAGLDPVDATPLRDPCTVAGMYVESSVVEWFEVTDNARPSSHPKTYEVLLLGFQAPNHAVVKAGTHLLMAIPIATEAEWYACDQTRAMTPGTYATSRARAGASIDAGTLTVVRLFCNQ